MTDTGGENSEVVKATHPSHQPNDPTVEEPNIKEQLLMARAEIRDLRSQVEALKFCKFGLERFSTDNDSIKFYTGFPSYFMNFLNLVPKQCNIATQIAHLPHLLVLEAEQWLLLTSCFCS